MKAIKIKEGQSISSEEKGTSTNKRIKCNI